MFDCAIFCANICGLHVATLRCHVYSHDSFIHTGPLLISPDTPSSIHLHPTTSAITSTAFSCVQPFMAHSHSSSSPLYTHYCTCFLAHSLPQCDHMLCSTTPHSVYHMCTHTQLLNYYVRILHNSALAPTACLSDACSLQLLL
jgi:hypothetical protein